MHIESQVSAENHQKNGPPLNLANDIAPTLHIVDKKKALCHHLSKLELASCKLCVLNTNLTQPQSLTGMASDEVIGA